VESAEILAEILHPECETVCEFGHRGRTFVPYSHNMAQQRSAAAR
jgi:hypothetical protein